MNTDRTEEQEQTLAQRMGLTRQEAQVLATIGCDLAQAGELEQARIVFEGLVALNPRDSAVQAALGTVYQKLERPEDAERAYEAALAHDADNPIALANRGELRLKRSDVGGLADLVRAADVDPTGTCAAGRRARALVQLIAAKSQEGLAAAS